MKRGYLILALLLVAAPRILSAQGRPANAAFTANPIPGSAESRQRTNAVDPDRRNQERSKLQNDKAQVEQTIRDSICWAITKDRARLERAVAHDADLFIINPDSTPTIGWDELVKNFSFWMDPRFKAVTCDVRDLRVNVSPSRDAAWWSAMLDDLAEWDGKPTGWKDTRWTGVLVRRDGAWVIVQMHFSFASDKVRAEALAAAKKHAAAAK